MNNLQSFMVGDSGFAYDVEGIGDQSKEMGVVVDCVSCGFVEIFSELTAGYLGTLASFSASYPHILERDPSCIVLQGSARLCVF